MEEELVLFEFEQDKQVYCDKKINELFNNIKIVYKLLGYNYDIEINNYNIIVNIDDNRINIYYTFKYFNNYEFEVKFIFKNVYNKFILDYMRINNTLPYSLFYGTIDEIINGLENLLKKN
jgi:hypothetical protein